MNSTQNEIYEVLKQFMPGRDEEILKKLGKLAPDKTYINLKTGKQQEAGFTYEMWVADFKPILDREEDFTEKKILIESEIRKSKLLINGLSEYSKIQSALIFDKQQRELKEEDAILLELCDMIDIPTASEHALRFLTYLEDTLQRHIGNCFYITQEELDAHDAEILEKHVQENQLVSQLDTISIPYSKHKLTLEYVLKRFVEQNINKQVEAEVLLDLFDFLHTEYSYPRDRTEEVERALEAKVEFCNKNSSSDEDEILNKKKAAKLLGISEPTLNNWLRDDLTLPFIRPGHKYQFNRKELLSWKYNKNCLKDYS